MRRVLVVDDDPELSALVAAVLDAAGYRPSVATRAGAALAGVRARPPDLILTDLAMPAMDGLALRAELRREGFGGIPVLVMSAHQRPAGVSAAAFLASPSTWRPSSPRSSGCSALPPAGEARGTTPRLARRAAGPPDEGAAVDARRQPHGGMASEHAPTGSTRLRQCGRAGRGGRARPRSGRRRRRPAARLAGRR